MQRIIILLGLIISIFDMTAKTRSVEEMATLASDFFNKQSLDKLTKCKSKVEENNGDDKGVNLIYSSADINDDGSPIFRIYNSRENNKGFVIIPSEDSYGDIIGYSYTGFFDESALPPGLGWLLETYAEVMKRYPQASAIPSKVNDDYAPISPLIQSKWDQGAPYNILLPNEGELRCVVGCVATSMAQLIRYFEPKEFRENVGLIFDESYPSAKFDFSERSLDWSLIKDTYKDENWTEAEAEEVARLMLACGVAVNMQYSPIESGAYTTLYMPYALSEYFNFDRNIIVANREDYTASEWEELIYSELKKGCPVNYDGMSTEGGHSFICDGYDKDGFFHFNWGWSGIGDGFYKLSMLNPTEQGIGGSLGGFNSNQSIVAGLSLDNNHEILYPLFVNDASFQYLGTDNESVKFQCKGQLCYYWPTSGEVEFGVTFEDIRSGEKHSYLSDNRHKFGATIPNKNMDILNDVSIVIPMLREDLDVGQYRVYPVYRPVNAVEWKKIPLKASRNRSLLLIQSETGDQIYLPEVVADNPEIIEPGYEFEVKDIRYRVIDKLRRNIEITSIANLNNDQAQLNIAGHINYSGIDYTVTKINNAMGVFSNCGKISTLILPETLSQTIDDNADWFYALKNLRTLSIPNGLSGLRGYHLKSCIFLENIVISPDHKELYFDQGKLYRFDSEGLVLEYIIPGLTQLELQDDVVRIAEGCIENHSNLTSISLGKGINKLDINCFSGCMNLKKITLSEMLDEIDISAFNGDERIEEFTVFSMTPPKVTSSSENNFEKRDLFSENVYKNATLRVPKEAFFTYKLSIPWKYFNRMSNAIDAGIDNVSDINNISFNYNGGYLHIYGLELSKIVNIHSINGILLFSSEINESVECKIGPLAQGIYIISVGSKKYKVIL